jgi:hypothetical protein
VVYLKLCADSHTLEFPLLPSDDSQLAYGEAEIDENSVYDDCDYRVYLRVQGISEYDSVKLFVNDELIPTHKRTDTDSAELFPKDGRIFADCFGVAQVECIVNDVSFVSKNIPVMMRSSDVNKNVANMIDYIYTNGERYLYENRRSIEAKLDILQRTLETYKKCYQFFVNAPKKKLISEEVIGSFEKLETITFKTMRHIVSHPEELVRVNYDTGIKISKQNFQPQNTLISTAAYSEDVFENQIVVGFLRTVIFELRNIDKQISGWLTATNRGAAEPDTEYIDSMVYVYSESNRALDRCHAAVRKLTAQFEKMHYNYSTVLRVSSYTVGALPAYTSVFRSVKAYSLVYKQIFEWFNYGNYNLEKSNVVFRFISTSKIYEYFCLVKINSCLENHMGYKLIGDGYEYKYPEMAFYTNTGYNNTFEFVNESDPAERVTVYFQPVVSVNTKPRNNIRLFRNTTYSMSRSDTQNTDGSGCRRGTFYSPDFIIKVAKNNTAKYFILDAKFSTVNVIAEHQLSGLVFKYWFSISAYNPEDSVSGICFMCGKGNDTDEIVDVYNVGGIKPSAKFIKLNGANLNDYSQIKALLKEYVAD